MSGVPIITPLDGIVGKNVKRLRTEKQISQEQLSEILGCSVAFVSYLETGKRAWSNKWIWDICQYFGVEAAELFDGAKVSKEDLRLLEAIKSRIDVYSEQDAIKSAKEKS